MNKIIEEDMSEIKCYGGCDAFCECSLGGAEGNNIACEFFDDTSIKQLEQLRQKKLRYVLRNQDRITDKLGKGSLDRMVKSLDRFFANPVDINEYLTQAPDERYYTLGINDVTNENYMILFYIVSQQCDILRLAFKGFFKG